MLQEFRQEKMEIMKSIQLESTLSKKAQRKQFIEDFFIIGLDFHKIEDIDRLDE